MRRNIDFLERLLERLDLREQTAASRRADGASCEFLISARTATRVGGGGGGSSTFLPNQPMVPAFDGLEATASFMLCFPG